MAVSDRSHRKPVCRVVACTAEKARTWQCGRGWARPGHVDVVVVGVVVKGVACSLQLVLHALAVGSLLPENSTHHCRARLLSRPFRTTTTVLRVSDQWLVGSCETKEMCGCLASILNRQRKCSLWRKIKEEGQAQCIAGAKRARGVVPLFVRAEGRVVLFLLYFPWS